MRATVSCDTTTTLLLTEKVGEVPWESDPITDLPLPEFATLLPGLKFPLPNKEVSSGLAALQEDKTNNDKMRVIILYSAANNMMMFRPN